MADNSMAFSNTLMQLGGEDFLRELTEFMLNRIMEGEWPYLWLDATYVKVRKNGRVASVAVIIACAVSSDGRREIIGMGIGESEAKVFWLAFLLSLKERGLEGVKLVISDSHSGLKAAIQQVFCASWQRCRVHFMRNVLSRVSRASQSVVRAALQQVFVQTEEKSAHHLARGCRPTGEEQSGGHGDDGRSGRGRAGVLRLPESAPGENPLDEHAGAPEQRGETARGRGGHLPQRREHHAASGGCADGAERGIAAAEPLPATTQHGGDRPDR